MSKQAKLERAIHEAVSDCVAAHQMLGDEDIVVGTEITFDHCFGDESTDARHPDQSWTRLTTTVEQSHMDRAQILRVIYERRAA